MVKNHLRYPDEDTERYPLFPLTADDHERVNRAANTLLNPKSL